MSGILMICVLLLACCILYSSNNGPHKIKVKIPHQVNIMPQLAQKSGKYQCLIPDFDTFLTEEIKIKLKTCMYFLFIQKSVL